MRTTLIVLAWIIGFVVFFETLDDLQKNLPTGLDAFAVIAVIAVILFAWQQSEPHIAYATGICGVIAELCNIINTLSYDQRPGGWGMFYNCALIMAMFGAGLILTLRPRPPPDFVKPLVPSSQTHKKYLAGTTLMSAEQHLAAAARLRASPSARAHELAFHHERMARLIERRESP